MQLYLLSTGDRVYRHGKSMIIRFEQARKVLSTSLQNGGYREDLTAVFNHDCNPGPGKEYTWRAATYEAHMRLVATEAGLDPDTVSGMATAASMENVAMECESFESLTVTALVTGGIDVNGGRVGDPATYFQPVDKSALHKPGTINIILVIDADLPPAALVRAMVTCTEAKTAALQELMAGSNYSCGLATGSGTDSTMIIANPASPLYLEAAGKHSKLGELIGRVVMKATKQALQRQTGLSPQQQHSVLRRIARFGVNEETLWQEYGQRNTAQMDKKQFLACLAKLDTQPQLVTYTSLLVHLLDQLQWGLLSGEEVVSAGSQLLTLAAASISSPCPKITEPKQQDCIQAWSTLLVNMLEI